MLQLDTPVLREISEAALALFTLSLHIRQKDDTAVANSQLRTPDSIEAIGAQRLDY